MTLAHPVCGETQRALRAAALIGRYDANLPRYTSYPTAAQFTPDVGPGEWKDWLAAAPAGEAVSLYVHIPFCKTLCWYCACNTRAVNRSETIRSYVDLLIEEARLTQAALGRRQRVARLHLGGGTPNMVAADDLDRLFAGLREAFAFVSEPEIAAELDPASLTRTWVRAAARNGLSRASLGVQDLSPRVQQAINRFEPFETVSRAADWLWDAGVGSLNLDLMYGLPLQTRDDLLTTLDQVTTLRPARIALFGYAHVPWLKPHQKLINEADLPGPEERFAQSQAAAAYLTDAGYQAVGLDHFALPHDSLAIAARSGGLHRNFQGYTTDDASTLIGLGASSIGRTTAGYVQNHAVERDWRAAVAEGRLPVARGLALTQDDRRRAEVIERLMCDFSVSLAETERSHGPAPDRFVAAVGRLSPLVADGLVVCENDRVSVTDPGRPFVRLICAAFDTSLAPTTGRHGRMI
ncbi:oxygen-independent coproporphyrinogen III oxidase [Brevundimonas subvibrioides]|uniref:oxygen-independent coproporphyrinogen III oxidase n=1 Tax=Brevundimonas subvibrioides TaxID=74313 RepID=UPI0022B54471|nr:oxygen-independent coproporphyrinogen III oxidase [Brevundimonas subvibrioides]